MEPTLIGHVASVSGAAVRVRLSPSVASGISIISGKSYRIGQVSSFVRIPQGYNNIYGIVAEVGANAAPESARVDESSNERWMTVQLVGEIVAVSFERGISQYPNVNDEVHLVTEEDLQLIYGSADVGQVIIGRLANVEGIPVRIDLDKLVTRHSAILGSTGSGKSTTVASILRSLALGTSDHAEPFVNARVLLLDVHGEYSRALQPVAKVFRINPSSGEEALNIPFWALETEGLLRFLMGHLEDKALTGVLDHILELKIERARAHEIEGIDINSMTSDSPVPFSLKKLWSELLEPEIKTWSDQQRSTPALLEKGDANTLKVPRYSPPGAGSTPPFINQINILGIKRPLNQLRSRLLDRQYDFLLHPGAWEPDLNGETAMDLSALLSSWLGHDRPITILDLSGIPSPVMARLIGSILRIIYDAMFWARDKSEGAVSRPLLIVLEEAHRYLSKETNSPARDMIQRVVKEGRKFGLGAMIVSQRPTEVDETILSQCGTFIALRLSNSSDRGKVQSLLSDNLAGVVESLPVLRTGEAIVIGEAARLPIRCRVSLPEEQHRPNSGDPEVTKSWHHHRIPESYERVVASWRAQNPRWAANQVARLNLTKEEIAEMEREMVASSNVVSIGYDPGTETLEVEFKNEGVYQYYNVPESLYRQLMESDSKGKFLHVYIKNVYPFSRV